MISSLKFFTGLKTVIIWFESMLPFVSDKLLNTVLIYRNLSVTQEELLQLLISCCKRKVRDCLELLHLDIFQLSIKP